MNTDQSNRSPTRPGIGTVASVGLPPSGPPTPPTVQAGGLLNDLGQVLLAAKLTDGRVVLLVAHPEVGLRRETSPPAGGQAAARRIAIWGDLVGGLSR